MIRNTAYTTLDGQQQQRIYILVSVRILILTEPGFSPIRIRTENTVRVPFIFLFNWYKL